jgi:acetylornithine deacetylase/succinyl-diaminopimelate desuccinylase-like protein
VIVVHTVMEERGGLGMKRLLDDGEVAPDVVIIGEATHGDVCIGHRGRAELEIVLHGVAGHASAPERARNALDLLPAVLEAVREVAADQPHDPVLGPATMVVTGVEAAPSSRNVIPDRVAVTLDWRVLPAQTREALAARVQEAVAARLPEIPEGYRVEVGMARERQTTWTGVAETKDLFTPGFLMGQDHPVVTAAATSVGRWGGAGIARTRPWTFATDGGWTCGVHGIPTLGFAPGEERYAHTNTERLALDEAEWAFARYPNLVLAVMEAIDLPAER